MKYSIEPRDTYLYAVVHGRETAEQTRELLLALHAAARQHGRRKALVSLRQSRPVFRPEDYGLNGYANTLASPSCQLAVVGDTAEQHAANEYIEMVARAQGLNVRAFRDEAEARAWLAGSSRHERRYKFTRIVVAGAPDEAGVYTLWDGDEVVYYGRADGGAATIRSRLLEHLRAGLRVTHYAWEVCTDPAAREAELFAEYRRQFGRLPKLNA